MKILKTFENFRMINEGVRYSELTKVDAEVKNNKGNYAIFKIQPGEKQTISEELKPHIGKFVQVENSHSVDDYTKVDSLYVWKESGTDAFENTGQKIQNLGEGGDLNFMELVAIVGPTNNPKKIKNPDTTEGGWVQNPNYKENMPYICKIIKKY